jgi:hypothetical protein
MSLTRNKFDKNAYRAQLKRSTDHVKYRINDDYSSSPTCRPDHLNGFMSQHGAPGLVDHESDLLKLDSILSDDPYMKFPKVNNSHKHSVRKECSKIPSIQYTRLFYYYPLSELSYNRTDHLSMYMHPIHANNYIGMNTQEIGRFTDSPSH